MTAAFPFDAVIFDCDGVLVDSERLVNDLEARLLSGLGLALSAEDARVRFKGRTVEHVVEVVEALLRQRLPAAWVYDWGMHTALGFVQDLRAVEGVRDVLDLLARRGVAVGVASQSPRPRVDLSLVVTGLAHYFGDRVVTASAVPRAKPCPDVFLLSAARLGVEPHRCAVVEDSPTGVTAAVAAGMTVFGYTADEEPALLAGAGATTFDAMDQLPGLLERAARVEVEPQSDVAGRLRVAYDRLAAGDVGPIAEFLAADVVYHLPGKHLGGGILHGRQQVLERLASAARSLDAPPQMRLLGAVGWGDLLVSLERFAARRSGRVLDQEVCVVWRLVRGQCVEIWSRYAEQPACDRFWEVRPRS